MVRALGGEEVNDVAAQGPPAERQRGAPRGAPHDRWDRGRRLHAILGDLGAVARARGARRGGGGDIGRRAIGGRLRPPGRQGAPRLRPPPRRDLERAVDRCLARRPHGDQGKQPPRSARRSWPRRFVASRPGSIRCVLCAPMWMAWKKRRLATNAELDSARKRSEAAMTQLRSALRTAEGRRRLDQIAQVRTLRGAVPGIPPPSRASSSSPPNPNKTSATWTPTCRSWGSCASGSSARPISTRSCRSRTTN